MNVAAFLLEGMPTDDTPALHADKAWVDYAALRSGMGGWAAGLADVPGPRHVLLLAPNGRFWVEAYLGILAAGHIAVPLDTRLAPDAIREIAARTNPVLALVHSKLARRIPGGLPCPVRTEQEAVEAGGAPVRDAAADDPAVVVFTSGSTGIPKGVVISHGNLIANTDAIVAYLRLGPADCVEAVLPLSYCFGASLLHTHLRVGGRLVLNNRFFLTKSVIRDFEAHGCTGFAGVPSHYEMLLRNTDFLERDFPALRYLAQAGGALGQQTLQVLADKPGVELFVMYGQTEATARLSYMPPERLALKPRSIGRGLKNVELAVLRADGSRADVGEEGEIAARGPSIMLGYLDDPEATSEKIVDGWLRTGDLGQIDEEGDVTVTGRTDDMVKLGGFRSNLGAIRRHIAGLQGVRDAAVALHEDPRLDTGIVAACELHPGVDLEAVMAACRATLPSYQVPRRILVVDSLPRTGSGKIDGTAVRRLLDAHEDLA